MSTKRSANTEFDFLKRLRTGRSLARLGDDCAVFPADPGNSYLITSDMLVEDVDFRLVWASPQRIGHKALAVSLSDIAAMGGTPIWAMVSIAVPKTLWNKGFVEHFYEGWFDLAKTFGVELIGGDLSSSPDRVSIDSTVIGKCPTGDIVYRGGAIPGDDIYVTGSLGGAAAGLKLLEDGHRENENHSITNDLILRQLKPEPQTEIGKWLSENDRATSMIDLSDGISGDLRHICEAGGVGAEIYAERLPLAFGANIIFKDRQQMLSAALSGGDDLELLFTTRPNFVSRRRTPRLTRIGRITDRAGVIDLIDGEKHIPLSPDSFRHF